MTSSDQFNAFAASRGEGLHPKLRDLLERAAASPLPATSIRHDGMIQAGPNPASELAKCSDARTTRKLKAATDGIRLAAKDGFDVVIIRI
jgi:hypothetical protein